MKITIPGELPDLSTYVNAERGNRFAGARIKKDATEMVQWSATRAPLCIGQVVVRFTWYTKNEKKDADNVAFAKKFVLDGLVNAGVLINDSRRFVRGFEDRFEVDADNPRIEVELLPFIKL